MPDAAFVLLIQGSWVEAYHELGKHTEQSYTGEWRPPTATLRLPVQPMTPAIWPEDLEITCDGSSDSRAEAHLDGH
jgi:hypothetical protein